MAVPDYCVELMGCLREAGLTTESLPALVVCIERARGLVNFTLCRGCMRDVVRPKKEEKFVRLAGPLAKCENLHAKLAE